MNENQIEGIDYIEIEPIGPINDHRKKQLEKQKKQEELKRLKEERLELELNLSLQKEKARIEKARNLLDGKIFCDDCKNWVYPSHFDKL